jgi:hypothetical protein
VLTIVRENQVEDGRTWPQAVDLESGTVVGVTVHDGRSGLSRYALIIPDVRHLWR